MTKTPMELDCWKTALSYATADEIRIRGYDLVEMISTVPFSQALYLLFMGELPSPGIGRLMDAVMVASIDHGAGAPSTLTARTVASTGAPLNAAGAAGLLALNRYHGAAIGDSMTVLKLVVERVGDFPVATALEQAAEQVVNELRVDGHRVGGFGHRQHAYDPRVDHLFQLAVDIGVKGNYLAASRAVASALESIVGRSLPINIDGAIAAIFCEIDFPKSLANVPFYIARLTGILAHAHEEREKMPPMRRIDPVNHGYCGPEDRSLVGDVSENHREAT